jgi:hypothetical protein
MTEPRPHLSLVQSTPPAVPQAAPERVRQRPPIKPRRPAAAVRKSLRTALATSSRIAGRVIEADARIPAKARRAVLELQGHAKRITALTDELHYAVECEVRYHLWRHGKTYAE